MGRSGVPLGNVKFVPNIPPATVFALYVSWARYTDVAIRRQFENLLSVNKTRYLARCVAAGVFAHKFACKGPFSAAVFAYGKGFCYVWAENGKQL